MIALDFNDPVFQRSTGATAFFQRRGQFLQRVFGQRHAGDGRHRLATTALALATHAGYAVPGRDHGLFADTGVHRLAAFRAVAAADAAMYRAKSLGRNRVEAATEADWRP